MRHKEEKLARANFIKESRKWQAALNDLRTRNIQLKERLSQAINGDVSHAFVEQAEFFQQQFVEKDQIVDLLRHDVKTMLDKLPEHIISGIVAPQYTVLQKDMIKLIDEFYQMEISFSRFVAVKRQ